jgi:hypothetical protein
MEHVHVCRNKPHRAVGGEATSSRTGIHYNVNNIYDHDDSRGSTSAGRIVQSELFRFDIQPHGHKRDVFALRVQRRCGELRIHRNFANRRHV